MSCLYCDADGRIVDIDRTTAAALGWRRHEVLNTLLVDHVHPDAMVEFERSWPALVATAGSTRSVHLQLRRSDGLWQPVRLADTNRLDDADFNSVQSIVTFLEPGGRAPARSDRTPAAMVPPPLVLAPFPEPLEVDSAYVRKNHLPLRVGWRERCALAAIVLIGLLVRVWDLGSLPISLHGDEAATGLDAVRILNDGWIGVYTPSALGQPAGPFYASALSVAMLGRTVFALRVVSAIVGALTIYTVFRVATPRFGVRVGLIAAGILALLNWHLHYTRLAFGVAWWPLATLLAIGAIDRALRRDDEGQQAGRWGVRWSWAAAGFWSVIGVYIYNAHWSVVGALATFVAAVTMLGRADGGFSSRLGRFGTFIGASLITLVPMFTYMLGGNGYSHHFSQFSVRSTPEWLTASFGTKAEMILRGYLSAWNRILIQPQPDLADGSGILRPVPVVFVLAFVLGVLVLLLRHRNALAGSVAVVCLALPMGPAMTIDGAIRRDVAMAPLVALVAGVGLSFVWQRLPFGEQGRSSWLLRTASVAALIAVVGGFSTWQYFDSFRNDPSQQWTFSGELAAPIDVMNEVGANAEVNLYSRRHSINYETIQFLAPGIVGRDRVAPFVDDENIEPHPDAVGPQLFLLVGPDTTLISSLRERYPDGEVIGDWESGGIAFNAFLVDTQAAQE